MRNKTLRSFKTFIKFVGWSMVAAGIVAVSQYIPKLALPEWAVIPIAAVLKSLLTFAKTEAAG